MGGRRFGASREYPKASRSNVGASAASSTQVSGNFGCAVYARGEILNVRIKVGEQNEWLKTMVSWSRRHDENVYKISLRFLGRIDEDTVREQTDVIPMGGYVSVPSAGEKAAVASENAESAPAPSEPRRSASRTPK